MKKRRSGPVKKPHKIEISIDPMGRSRATGDLREWETFEAKYKESGDPNLLALAIGGDPAGRPAWALEECRTLYDDYVHKAPSYKPDTASQLDEMADAYVKNPATFTVHKAATRAVKADGSGSNEAVTLSNAWNKERLSGRLEGRIGRAFLRLTRLTV